MNKKVEKLLSKIYGGRHTVHIDLYQLSNEHRRKHGPDCELFPSDPLESPLWPVLTSLTHARRILEVGCGHGYTTSVMATATGPGSHVDTIEGDPGHAALAEEAFRERGLSKRISVLQGRGKTILPRLKRRYDLIFLDGDWEEYPLYIKHLSRITRPGSVILTANLNPLLGGWGGRMRGKKYIESYLMKLVRDKHFRTYIIPNEGQAISVRV